MVFTRSNEFPALPICLVALAPFFPRWGEGNAIQHTGVE